MERYYSAQSYVSGVETITPELAEEMLKRNTHNRPISNPYVTKLSKEMASGNWQLNGQSINFTTTGVLLDGQHRLKACIKAGVPFTTVVAGGFSEDTFKTTDCGRGRNLGQLIGVEEKAYYQAASAVLRNYVMFTDGNKGYRHDQTTVAVSSMSGRSVREYYSIYETMKDKVLFYASLSNKFSKKINYFPITAAYSCAMMMYLVENLGYEFDFVKEFFDQLYNYQTPSDSNIRLLWKKMLDIRADRNANHVYCSRYKISMLNKTWNLYATGKSVKQLNIGSGDVELLSAYEAKKLL